MANPNIANEGVEHRFQPGRSGNPNGKRRTFPISERYKVLLETPAPAKVRHILEAKIQAKDPLPDDFSFGDAIVMINLLAATGVPIGGMLQLSYSREIREAVEGNSIQLTEPEGERDREAIRGSIMGKLMDMMVGRAKTYGMDIPQLNELTKESELTSAFAREQDKPQ